jgi:hypothetical protein
VTPAQRHMELVARAGCVIGNRRLALCDGQVEVHHVAEGSSKRSDFATVGLCTEHHTGGSGFHGLRAERFCKLYRVPWEKEEGLLVWANEDIAKLRVKVAA